MEQHIAVKKMMLSIKVEEIIPKNLHPLVRDYLTQMYVVGWEQGRKELAAHNKKQVGQFNQNGDLINVFDSVAEAAKKTRCKATGIYSAILKKSVSRQGWTWKYTITP